MLDFILNNSQFIVLQFKISFLKPQRHKPQCQQMQIRPKAKQLGGANLTVFLSLHSFIFSSKLEKLLHYKEPPSGGFFLPHLQRYIGIRVLQPMPRIRL
jgi:hypothetical protein